MSSPVSADPASSRPLPVDPARAPLSGPRRLGLLMILLILPVLAVSLPAIFVTFIFGQRPRPAPAVDVSGLRGALQRNAAGVLPTPGALAAEPILITVRAGHVDARAARVAALAAQFGGSVAEGLPKEGEKDLYVDVPSAAAAQFRSAVSLSAPVGAAPPPPPAGGGVNVPPAVDHLEVIIRAAADDE